VRHVTTKLPSKNSALKPTFVTKGIELKKPAMEKTTTRKLCNVVNGRGVIAI
jgi:hypothetical protein